MFRRLAKRIVGKYDEKVFVSVGRYYGHINRVEKKLKRMLFDAVLTVLLLVLFIGGTAYVTYEWLFAPQGYYEGEYRYDEEGNKYLYDIDGDGDCYHWVDPE